MKLTSLVIQPERSYAAFGTDNPLRAVVKLNSEKSTVECVLSDETMHKMLELCADEIAASAKKNVDDFASAVSMLDGGKSQALLQGAE